MIHCVFQDADGFYTGQVGEAFGLVPSNFLQKEKKKKEEAVSRKQTVGKTSEIEKWYATSYACSPTIHKLSTDTHAFRMHRYPIS